MQTGAAGLETRATKERQTRREDVRVRNRELLQLRAEKIGLGQPRAGAQDAPPTPTKLVSVYVWHARVAVADAAPVSFLQTAHAAPQWGPTVSTG